MKRSVTETKNDELTFRFSSPENRSIFGNIGHDQMACLVISLCISLLSIFIIRGPVGILFGFTIVLVGIVCAFVRVNSYTPCFLLFSYLEFKFSQFNSRQIQHLRPLCGHLQNGDLNSADARNSLFQVSLNRSENNAGYIVDFKEKTVSIAILLCGNGLGLNTLLERNLAVMNWAEFLSSLAQRSNKLHRIQLLKSTFVDDFADLEQPYYRDENSTEIASKIASNSYNSLVDSFKTKLPVYETLLVLSRSSLLNIETISEEVKSLLSEVEIVSQSARRLGIETKGILSDTGLTKHITRSFVQDPCTNTSWPNNKSYPWPLSTSESWEYFKTDANFHASFWISEWPRNDVGADFLAPVILTSSIRLTFSVVFEAIESTKALREVERHRTETYANKLIRKNAGFLETAKRQLHSAGIDQREAELSLGHSAYRFSGYLRITAATIEDLERCQAELETTASRSHLEIRRLYGNQKHIFSYGLPIARGLK